MRQELTGGEEPICRRSRCSSLKKLTQVLNLVEDTGYHRQVTHRDLKSLNLLLAALVGSATVPSVKISDFGLSRGLPEPKSQACMTSGAGDVPLDGARSLDIFHATGNQGHQPSFFFCEFMDSVPMPVDTTSSDAHTATADAEADTAATHNAAAAKKNSECIRDTLRPQDNESEKAERGDDEIKRLSEERRGIAKGDKQQLKEVSKRIKKCIRDKKIKKTRKDTSFQR